MDRRYNSDIRLPDPTGKTMYHRYPKDFIREVKKEFPENAELHKALENAEVSVGKFLEQHSMVQTNPEDLIRALNKRNTASLKAAAKKAIRINKLHSRWLVQYVVSG